ncbi:MAG TPA: HAMP domain-containing protein, partial [Acidobacteriaceae bacterium]|nr:HAMP domain-containing protein [Acidobacteriaceae bacterium]
MEASTSRRKSASVVLGSVLLVLLLGFTALNAFNLKFFNSLTTGEMVVFTGLSILAFLLFMAGLLLLGRNVLKLYADQRNSVMGTRLRTRMLWGAVLVSLIPLVFMFFFSYGLMNRAVDRWFSQNPNEIRDDSGRLAQELAQYTSANARVEAESIAASLSGIDDDAAGHSAAAGRREDRRNSTAPDRQAIDRILHQHEITLQNGFAIVYREGMPVASFHMPAKTHAPAQVRAWLPEQGTADEDDSDSAAGPTPHRAGDDRVVDASIDSAILAAAQRNDLPIFSQGDTDYALGVAAMKQGGLAVVGLPMPYGMTAAVTRFQAAVDDYAKAYRQRRAVRTLYTLILLMMTSLALFACSWLALHLSKLVTKPVEALADAMEAIAAGDYAHRVGESVTEELGELVSSFNHMAADLEGSRRDVESSNRQLSAANAALQARRGELEIMLETIPSGVATIDVARRVVLANRALTEMLDPGGQTAFIGTSIAEIFPAEVLEQIDHLLRRSHRMGAAAGEMEMTQPG